MTESWCDVDDVDILESFELSWVWIGLRFIPLIPSHVVDLFWANLQEYITVVHINSTHLFLHIDSWRSELSTYYFVRIEFHDPCFSFTVDNDDHVISSGDIDNTSEVANLIEGSLVVADEGSWLLGEDEEVVIAGCAGGYLVPEWYFLGEWVCFFMVLFEEVIVVAWIR